MIRFTLIASALFASVMCPRPAAAEFARVQDVSVNAGSGFVENRGQVADSEGRMRRDIRAVIDCGGASLFFTDRGVSYVFSDITSAESRTGSSADLMTKRTGLSADGRGQDAPLLRSEFHRNEHYPLAAASRVHRIDMELLGAAVIPRIRFENELPGYRNFYLPHCPEGITHVKSYATMIYEEVYPFVDLVFIAADGRVKYEYRVRPGGDPGDIRMRYHGMEDIRLLPGGMLELVSPIGRMEEAAPFTFEDGGREIRTAYRIRDGELSFDIGTYDRGRTLVIDPWGSYYGTGGTERFTDIVIDGQDNVYVAGDTSNRLFPTSSAVQPNLTGGYDLVIGKFDPSGIPLWMTYYGGSGNDEQPCLAVNAAGTCFISGWSHSYDFPVRNAFQSVHGGTSTPYTNADAVLLSLAPNGTCQWASYYGGSDNEMIAEVVCDAVGNVLMAGWTRSSDFPVSPSAYQTVYRGSDAFVLKFTDAGNRCWATFLGGDGTDAAFGLAADATGNIVAGLGTTSAGLPTGTNVLQAVNAGFYDIYIARFDPAGGFLSATYLGGSGDDGWYQRGGLLLDTNGEIYLVTETTSADFPVTAGAYQPVPAGYTDFVCAKLSADLGSIRWATYLGGGDYEYDPSIALDSEANVLLTGSTSSVNFPVYAAHQPHFGGGVEDMVAAKLASSSGIPAWITYYGGSRMDRAGDIAANSLHEAVIAGGTESQDIPVLAQSWQPSFGGYFDGIITSFSSTGTGPPLRSAAITVSPAQTVPNHNLHTIYRGIGAQALTLTATSTSTAPAVAYAWSTGATTSSITVAPLLPTVYSVTVTDAVSTMTTASVLIDVADYRCGSGLTEVQYCINGSTKCESESKVLRALSRDVTAFLGPCGGQPLNQLPTAVADATPTSGTAPLAVQFTGSNSWDADGSIIAYHWDFGDGNSAATADPLHTYTAAGSYMARLTVTDNANAAASAEAAVTVSAPSTRVVHVSSQVISRQLVHAKSNRWEAHDRITIRDQTGAPVADAVVTADFSGPNSGSSSGTTDANGGVTLVSASQKDPAVPWCFQVTSVQGTGCVLDASTGMPQACEAWPKSSSTHPQHVDLTVHPNPVHQQAIVQFRLPSQATIHLLLRDMLGRPVINVSAGMYHAGVHTATINTAALPSGCYVLSLLSKGAIMESVLLLK